MSVLSKNLCNSKCATKAHKMSRRQRCLVAGVADCNGSRDPIHESMPHFIGGRPALHTKMPHACPPSMCRHGKCESPKEGRMIISDNMAAFGMGAHCPA